MTTNNDNLPAPCPFCGAQPTWIHHSNRFDGTRLMSLGCCEFRRAGSEDELIAAWNRRAAIAAQGGQAAPAPINFECEGIGWQFSNIAFNWGQTPGRVITQSDCDMLRTLQRRWDDAISAKNSAPPMQQAKPDAPAADDLVTVIAFLLGEGSLDGFHFGDSDTARPRKPYWWRKHLRAALAAAAQPKAEPSDPMDWPLPCDVKVGCGTHGKGTALRGLVGRMQRLYDAMLEKDDAEEVKVAPSETVDSPEFRKLVSDVGFAHQFGGFAQDVARLIVHIDKWHAAGMEAEIVSHQETECRLIEALAAARQAKPLSDAVLLGKFNSADTVIDGLHEVQRAILASQEKQC